MQDGCNSKHSHEGICRRLGGIIGIKVERSKSLLRVFIGAIHRVGWVVVISYCRDWDGLAWLRVYKGRAGR